MTSAGYEPLVGLADTVNTNELLSPAVQTPRPTNLCATEAKEEGSWRRSASGKAPLLPRRRPRTSTALYSTRLQEPSRLSRQQPITPWIASPRSGANLALLTRRRMRTSVALRSAQLTRLELIFGGGGLLGR
eukprot:scaffold9804_cov62-Phaeocystis_antarctica.AAC.1